MDSGPRARHARVVRHNRGHLTERRRTLRERALETVSSGDVAAHEAGRAGTVSLIERVRDASAILAAIHDANPSPMIGK